MVSVKVLFAVADDDTRKRLLDTLSDLIVSPRPDGERGPLAAGAQERAVQFARIEVAPDLALHIYVIRAQRGSEYLCRILARDIAAYALVVEPGKPEALEAARYVGGALRSACQAPHLLVLTQASPDGSTIVRQVGLPADTPVTNKDVSRWESVRDMMCDLLRVASAAVEHNRQPA